MFVESSYSWDLFMMLLGSICFFFGGGNSAFANDQEQEKSTDVLKQFL